MAKSLFAVVVLGAVSASLSYSGLWRSSRSAADAADSVKIAVPERVGALGRIEPQGGIIAVAGPPAARVARVLVAEGQRVRRGQALVVLQGREELLAEKAHLQAQIREAERRLAAEDRFEEILRNEASVEYRQVKEVEPREIEAQEAKLDLLRDVVQHAEHEQKRIEDLASAVSITSHELEHVRSEVRRARDELKAGDLLLEKLRKAHEINLKRVEVAAKKAASTAAMSRCAIPIDSLRASLGLVDAKLDELEVKSPIDGRVLRVLAHAGESAGMKPMVQLGDVGTMEVVAEVYETDRSRVREGQRVEVRSPALPEGRTALRGVVERVGWTVAKNDVLGLDPAADAYARVVEVRIKLDRRDGDAVQALSNLQVDVTIDTPHDDIGSVARADAAEDRE